MTCANPRCQNVVLPPSGRVWRREYCGRPCRMRAAGLRHYHANGGKEKRQKVNPDDTRRWRYGMPAGEYEAQVVAQGGRCIVCGRLEKLVVDHNHVTGERRGLLCVSCNRGIGFFLENPDALRRAAEYVEKWNS